MNAITEGEPQPDSTINRNPGESDEEYSERVKAEEERRGRLGGNRAPQAEPGGGVPIQPADPDEPHGKGKHSR